MHSGNRSSAGRRLHRLLLAAAMPGLMLAAAGCKDLQDNASTSATGTAAGAVADSGTHSDPACSTAIGDISKYGPSTVKLLADAHDAASRATVELLVYGLDDAADLANSPQVKQQIQRVANDYDDYFHLTTEAETIPLSVLLSDTSGLESLCN